jgi:hypothetical protein
MRYHFTFAAIVSVLIAVAATVQDAPGKWLYLGVALVTVALENLTRRDDDHQFFPRESSRRGATDAAESVTVTSRDIGRATSSRSLTSPIGAATVVDRRDSAVSHAPLIEQVPDVDSVDASFASPRLGARSSSYSGR